LIEGESQRKQIIDKPHKQAIYAIKHFTKIDQRKNVAKEQFMKSNFQRQQSTYQGKKFKFWMWNKFEWELWICKPNWKRSESAKYFSFARSLLLLPLCWVSCFYSKKDSGYIIGVGGDNEEIMGISYSRVKRKYSTKIILALNNTAKFSLKL